MHIFVHPHLVLLAWLIMDVAGMAVLAAVASSRHQSKLFAVWGILGFPGLIAGLLLMLALPGDQPPQARPPMLPPN